MTLKKIMVRLNELKLKVQYHQKQIELLNINRCTLINAHEQGMYDLITFTTEINKLENEIALHTDLANKAQIRHKELLTVYAHYLSGDM